ncbi:MAG TPA: hypothetical protein VH639_13115 [Bryobacteraceae bacterium]|jgi:hypothetical protein
MAATDVIRKILPYSTLAVGLAMVYTSWVMYSRYRDAREQEQRIEKAKHDRVIEEGRQVSQVLGDDLRILSFSADEAAVRPGERVLLCYGVSNATTVKIEPGIEPLRPAVTHCLEAFPRKTTTYTLTAGDKSNHNVSASLTVTVK